MRELNGKVLAEYIKERQAKQAGLLIARGVEPKLVIIQAKDDAVIDSYVKMKRRYGKDIGVMAEIRKIDQSKLIETIEDANQDDNVHGLIVQLPLTDNSQADEAVRFVNPKKDVDGLSEKPDFEPATATAILWLLAGYNVDLVGKKIAIIGQGRLVGEPLSRMLESSGHEVVKIDEYTKNASEKVRECDVIVTATGVPRLVKSDWIKEGAVVVDAGTASEGAFVVGDVDDAVRERDDLKGITPLKGGVGPLTVCALFEHTLIAAENLTH
ncbi:bifunctional 5,10-methylenetetrahydrofolate dehydrogenase/5,10-methenyltetrahydrofolate cyclohydrolase [Candidatus Saccharibacteria bacterium]|jgi:methylenetetrahydrofolate dehydrogenase (NADP+)/methenyltetrahydrofolate cyclohydrolase|nr:bifunctional 5,10-methylenetetrahydrofolate dehydrogenase/5,10-methenyltetrahydrofolate cyclohydrolase [Candidatus Saccharibacteria bacterium]